MVKAKFETTDNEKTLILTVQGHAGAAQSGEDTVCAAASILAYTAAQEVKEMQEKGKLKKKPNIRLGEGDATITCKPVKNAYSEALHTFKVVQTGYRLLAANFPENVSLTTFAKDN